jgi:TonB family protein
MVFQRIGVAFLLILTLSPLSVASVEKSSRVSDREPNVSRREQQFGSLAVHGANFSALSRMTARMGCEATEPPEALATPDPLVDTLAAATKITVSFIIGTDGRVYSPLILESLGPSGDRIVLDAVRAWRYRPATCNGVPTEVEGTIAFSSR